MSGKYIKQYEADSKESFELSSDKSDDKKKSISAELMDVKTITPKVIQEYMKCNSNAIQELDRIEQYTFNIFNL